MFTDVVIVIALKYPLYGLNKKIDWLKSVKITMRKSMSEQQTNVLAERNSEAATFPPFLLHE